MVCNTFVRTGLCFDGSFAFLDFFLACMTMHAHFNGIVYSLPALYTTEKVFTMVATSTLNRNNECLSEFADQGYDQACIDYGKMYFYCILYSVQYL